MGKAPRKARPPPTAPDDPEQSKRFVDMAREIEADERPEVFEKAFNRVVEQRPKGPGMKRKPRSSV